MEKQMLTSFSDYQRTDAMKKYKIIEPYINKQETIKEISIRTLYRWVQKYEHNIYEAITTIIKITKGNFRLIHRLFAQIDRILRINQMDKITVEVVEAARDSLVVGI